MLMCVGACMLALALALALTVCIVVECARLCELCIGACGLASLARQLLLEVASLLLSASPSVALSPQDECSSSGPHLVACLRCDRSDSFHLESSNAHVRSNVTATTTRAESLDQRTHSLPNRSAASVEQRNDDTLCLTSGPAYHHRIGVTASTSDVCLSHPQRRWMLLPSYLH
jgi:hypothetical protein